LVQLGEEYLYFYSALFRVNQNRQIIDSNYYFDSFDAEFN
jgi:hypothetical protein